MKVPYRDLVKEPGTGFIVARWESDGQYNAVDHPQNRPLRPKQEGRPLRYATPDDNLEIPFIETQDDFVLMTEDGNPLLLEDDN